MNFIPVLIESDDCQPVETQDLRLASQHVGVAIGAYEDLIRQVQAAAEHHFRSWPLIPRTVEPAQPKAVSPVIGLAVDDVQPAVSVHKARGNHIPSGYGLR